jgi:DNA-directed RNA polymerase subunit H (RpoH/RPB5)|tara:strand:+ start:359 stop:937 length:579 start_codon:yes stop_codon:yes gene_type:complete
MNSYEILDINNPEIIKSFDTILYNLNKSGYTHEEMTEPRSYFIAKHTNGTRIHILYNMNKITKINMNKIISEISDKIQGDIVYIVTGSYSLNTLREQLKAEYKPPNYIIISNLSAHQFRILEHTYVPEHRILTEEEVDSFKNKYNIVDNSQIPEISRFDPVAQAIFMRPGQICKITRRDKATMEDYYYRICI